MKVCHSCPTFCNDFSEEVLYRAWQKKKVKVVKQNSLPIP